MPIQAMADHGTRVRFANVVPRKGTKHTYPEKTAVKNLNSLGYKKLILKTDQEPAIVDLAKEVKDNFTGDIIPENSPVGESQSNGFIERMIQSLEG